MQTNLTLLIADRNPHVRAYLQREMTAAGFQIRLAENAREVLELAFQGEPLDMIILDPDLPEADETHMLAHLLDRIPVLPVIMHTYPSDYSNGFKDRRDVVFVKKGGRSVERLKQVIQKTLLEPPSDR